MQQMARNTKPSDLWLDDLFRNLTKDLIEALPYPTYVKSGSRQWSYVNPAFCKAIQTLTPNLLGKSNQDIFTREIAQNLDTYEVTVQESGVSQSFEMSLPLINNTQGRFELLLVPNYADDGSFLAMVGIARDLTQQKRTEKILSDNLSWARFQADHDELTGLYNRRRIHQEMRRRLKNNDVGALILIDIDDFQFINNTYGHELGDEYLKEMASLLLAHLNLGEIIARTGSDEYAMLIPTNKHDVEARAAEVKQLFAEADHHSNSWSFGFSPPTVSIGIANTANEKPEPLELFQRADLALHQAKRLGPGSHVYYHPYHEEAAANHLNWRTRLKQALASDEQWQLRFQPLIHLRTGEVVKAETLTYLKDPNGGYFSPGIFIPIAESLGIMNHLSRHIIKLALKEKVHWRQVGHGQLFMSINLSAQNFDDAELFQSIERMMEENAVHPSELIFEVTESQAIHNLPKARAMMQTMGRLGVRFALDDFGVEFSSFNYLKHLPVQFIKIDGTFVRDLLNSPKDRAIVKALNEIAHAFGIETVAEYVETAMLEEALQEIGVDYGQGWLYGKPMAPAQFVESCKTRVSSS